MHDYGELVKRLREHNGWALNETLDQAADAIEALQSEIRQSMQRCAECGDELAQQLPKRGKWIVREVDIPGEIHPVAFRCMCSMCRNEYVLPRIPQYCPDCGSMNTAKMEVQDG